MGTLIVKRYRTNMALKVADHTYVECGTGAKGWGCWGGKTGGITFRQAAGSTLRADAIAEVDEKAGISCYLFSGVCHQASNRILQAADKSVDGVRGYTLSVAAFGHYGREMTLLARCYSPLSKHLHVYGDLPECGDIELKKNRIDLEPDDSELYDYRDSIYMSDVRSIYSRNSRFRDPSYQQLFESQMALFYALLGHRARRAGMELGRRKQQRVVKARERFEEGRMGAELEVSGFNQALEFANQFNRLTHRFQDDLAEALDSREYDALLGLSRDERFVLADPDILKDAYVPPSGPRGPAL